VVRIGSWRYRKLGNQPQDFGKVPRPLDLGPLEGNIAGIRLDELMLTVMEPDAMALLRRVRQSDLPR
jgi:hypothetical protein